MVPLVMKGSLTRMRGCQPRGVGDLTPLEDDCSVFDGVSLCVGLCFP